MSPSEAMQSILTRVESVTGFPVHLQPDPSLRTMAVVTAASDNLPVNVVRFRPNTIENREYLVSFQCGFVLRLFSLPKDQRWDVAGDDRGRYRVGKLLKAHLRHSGAPNSGDAAVFALTEQLFGGLITQIRSVPIGLRIDQWLMREFPALSEQQKKSIQTQLDENSSVLNPNIRQRIPAEIFLASATINSAFACFWTRAWSDSLHELPYKAAGLLDSGRQLLSILDRFADSPENDRPLIDAWADAIGVSDWFKFVER